MTRRRIRRVVVLSLLAIVLTGLPGWPRVASAAIACTPQLQWTWEGDVRAPDQPHVCVSPLVVQLTDDDGDGFIDANDMPDVAFLHYGLPPGGNREGRLTAIDGLTGREHFTAQVGFELFSAGLSAADIDGDGIVELLALLETGEGVVAFENDGSLKWTSDPPSVPFSFLDTIALADLDQDGSTEIVVGAVAYDANGGLLWEGTGGEGEQFIGKVSNVADLAPSVPGLEVLAGDTLYDAMGNILWQSSDVVDGWTAIADFTGDGNPEIAHVSIGRMNLLDLAGNALTPEYTFGSTPSSQPVAADLDGDGVAELFLMQAEEVRALDLVAGEWVELWRQPTEDPSRINGATAFDFDGDGALDLVYNDMVAWYIFDGPTGAVLHQEPLFSATGIETPVLADIDNDCLTEILVTACSGRLGPPYMRELRAYECAPAARARPMWNQFAYHVNNIEDDGTIPVLELPAWRDHNSWIGQVSTAVGAIATAAAETPVRICTGETVPLDASRSTGCTEGYEYRFSDGLAPICGWSANPLCEVTPEGSPSQYTVHVRCTDEPCEDQTEIVVALDPVPTAVAESPVGTCPGVSVALDGSMSTGCPGGYEYRFRDATGTLCDWSVSSNCEVTPVASPSAYALDVRCAGTPCEDQTEIVVEFDPVPTAIAESPVRTCEGESVSLNGSLSTGCPGGYEYRFRDAVSTLCDWSPDAVCEVTPEGSPSVYTLDVRCAGVLCEDRTEIVVELLSAPSADAGPPATVCRGQSIRIGGSPTGSGGAGGYAYLWESSPPGAIAAGEESLPNPNTTALSEPTTFQVTVTDAEGCAGTASVLIDVRVPGLPQEVGNTLRVEKDPTLRHAVLRWSTSDPEASAFRIRRGWPPASTYPAFGPDVGSATFLDTGVLVDGQNYGYLISGVNCSGEEGP